MLQIQRIYLFDFCLTIIIFKHVPKAEKKIKDAAAPARAHIDARQKNTLRLSGLLKQGSGAR